MLNPSAYALGANRSCIRDLFEYGCQRAAVVGRENVYDYSLGNPSIPSPKEVDETVRRILDDTDSLLIHGYTSAVGDYATRKAISDDLNARYGVSTVPEEFFIGCGAAPELVSVFRALAVPGAEILAVAPYFPEYKPFAQEAGLEFKVVPADIPFFQINLTAMEQMITPSTQAVILNSPNNPSGVVYTRETYQALAEILNSKAAEYGTPFTSSPTSLTGSWPMGSRCRSCRKFTGIPSSAIPIPSPCPSPANESAMCMCPRRPRTARRCIPPLRGQPGRAATSAPPACGRRSSPGAPISARTWRATTATARRCTRG